MRTKFIILFFLTAICFSSEKINGQEFNQKLQIYTEKVSKEAKSIDKSRVIVLDSIANFIFKTKKQNGKAQLLFVCTHNSRRSHISQIWLQTAAYYYGVDEIYTFSGGVEVTAANKRAIAALERAGFSATVSDKKSENTVYIVSQGKGFSTNLFFSKKYDDKQNPKENFAAIMVCSEADKSCPFIPGANARFSLPYDDPRYSDNTPSEEQTYDETTKRIAIEMLYIMSRVKEQENIEAEKHK
jgi:protein-tyrosine-phosphatase